MAIQVFRRQLKATLLSVNPVLALGELAIERDTGGFKWGNGTSTYTALPYAGIYGDIVDVVSRTEQDAGIELVTYSLVYSDGTTRDLKNPTDVNSVSVTLTPAQILASFTTPVQLIAAPGAGYVIAVESVTASIAYVSAAYATNTTQKISYTNGAGAAVTANLAAIVTATADKVVRVSGIEAETVLTANAAVVISTLTGNPTAGDSPLTVSVTYRVLPINAAL